MRDSKCKGTERERDYRTQTQPNFFFFCFCSYISHTRPDPITKRIFAVSPFKWRDAGCEPHSYVGPVFASFFLLLQLYTPHAPRPHNKANLCCTKLRLAGCEPHMSGRNPFYLLKIVLLTAEEGRVKW